MKPWADRQHGSAGPAADADLRRAAAFWRALLRSGSKARKLIDIDSRRYELLLYTDGCAPDPRGGSTDPYLRCGWLAFDLRDSTADYGNHVPSTKEQSQWLPRKTQVVMTETMAPVVAIAALADVFAGCRALVSLCSWNSFR